MNSVTLRGAYTLSVYADVVYNGYDLTLQYDETFGWGAISDLPEEWEDEDRDTFEEWLLSIPSPQIGFSVDSTTYCG